MGNNCKEETLKHQSKHLIVISCKHVMLLENSHKTNKNIVDRAL